MSSLGFQLVYSILGEKDELVCERFFLPEKGEQLRSVESQRPLSHFPIIFISISFEHDYQNLVQLLHMAGINPFADQRKSTISTEDPLIICGGVATFMNPEPLAPFVDMFVLGEAEAVFPDLIPKIIYTEESTANREEVLLDICSSIKGCYAPGFYQPQYADGADGEFTGFTNDPRLPARVEKAILTHSPVASHSQLMTPEAEFSEMHLTELGRGCSRGCRFCAAGFIYRPPRLWDGDAVVEGLRARYSDIDRVGLLGMEMADSESLERISDYLKESGCALSFSSLRADRLTKPLIDLLSASNLKSVAIAPDGSSERLRRVINKGLDESDLLDAAKRLVEAGIFKLKLYLMIGLPTETDEDLQEAIDLVGKIKACIDTIGKERGRLTEIMVSVNCFAPKPWTPFQYHPFGMSSALPKGESGDSKKVIAELKRRQKLLRKGLSAYANVHVQLDKPENVLFQAVLSRGDRRLAEVLNTMALTGIGWKQAMKKHHLRPEQFAVSGFDETSYFPWYIIDHGIEHDYLWNDYQRAFNEKLTIACDTSICRRCGVCHD
ncbi:radical SAM protein [Desulfosediminicola flagellatus]|uniref:radical SAM protein n=1 Tax=Desulfosediminicola flagellatus TaxID=2569541 RepID=UPI001E3052B8|nr:radical SAM protein [Desulfosediminicola flagellatus]